MKRFFFRYSTLWFFFLVMSMQIVLAQEKNEGYFPTPNTQIDAKPDPKKQKEKEKRIRFIITNDTKNTLSGNRCFEEVTRNMGFMYLAVPKGQAPNRNGFYRWWHNFGIKSMLVLKNGPFWKSKVNKRLKECKYKSGDYVG